MDEAFFCDHDHFDGKYCHRCKYDSRSVDAHPRKEAREWLDSCPTCKASFPEGGYHNCPAVRELREGCTSGAERSAILGFVRWSYPTRSTEEAERLVDSYLALKGNNHE